MAGPRLAVRWGGAAADFARGARSDSPEGPESRAEVIAGGDCPALPVVCDVNLLVDALVADDEPETWPAPSPVRGDASAMTVAVLDGGLALHLLDMLEVGGSIPSPPTKPGPGARILAAGGLILARDFCNPIGNERNRWRLASEQDPCTTSGASVPLTIAARRVDSTVPAAPLSS